MVSLPGKHGQGVVKDEAASLNTLIEPAGSVAFLVDRNSESLATTVVDRIDHGDIEFLGMLR